MRLVVDASVALKWYLAHRDGELHVGEAAAVGAIIESGSSKLFAPPHWVIEVLSVLSRLEPQFVDVALLQLTDMTPTIISNASVLRRAADLSILYNHHLFDTLYHAVALETGATLVTADDRYFAKAQSEGHITLLRDFQPPLGTP
ncbi:MAG: type II toxin-antitoxin system VapC family toxin [Hyphomicrobium sp.]